MKVLTKELTDQKQKNCMKGTKDILKFFPIKESDQKKFEQQKIIKEKQSHQIKKHSDQKI